MKFFLLLGLILVICITTGGCTQTGIQKSKVATQSPASVTIKPVPANGLSLATLSNKQPNTTLTLDPGVIIISFQALGPQEMQFKVNCGKNGIGLVPLRMTSPYNGTIAFQIPAKGEYIMSISGSGKWTAQVRRMGVTTPLEVPVNMSGFGSTVSQIFTLEKGQYIFQRDDNTTPLPLYELMFSNGSSLMDASNTFVQPGFNRYSPEPFRIINVPESGTYFLSIISFDNPKPWNASIVAMPKIPVMGPGPAITRKI